MIHYHRNNAPYDWGVANSNLAGTLAHQKQTMIYLPCLELNTDIFLAKMDGHRVFDDLFDVDIHDDGVGLRLKQTSPTVTLRCTTNNNNTLFHL